jgi:hypothetical protein
MVPTPVIADPVRVTGGAFDVDFEGDVMSFFAAGFALHHWTVSGVNGDPNLGLFIPKIGDPNSCLQPGADEVCNVGETIIASFRTPGEEYLGVGRAEIGGTTYTDVTFRGTLNFVAEPVPLSAPEGEEFVLHAPFGFTGAIRGLRDGSELFHVSLTGNGHVVGSLFRAGLTGDRFLLEETGATFVFEPTAAATPEPASLLLLLSGMAGVWARRRSG